MSDIAETPPGGRWGLVARWLQVAACGLLVFLMPAVGCVCAALLAPGLLALLLEQEPSRRTARILLAFGAMAAIEPVRFLWRQANDMEMAISILSDIRGIALAWVAAGVGWTLSRLIPLGIHMLLDMTARARAEQLRSTREALVAEWGLMERPTDQWDAEARPADQ